MTDEQVASMAEREKSMSIISKGTGKLMLGEKEIPIEHFSFEYSNIPPSEPEQDWREAMRCNAQIAQVFDIPVQLMGTIVVESTLVIVERTNKK